MRIFTKIFKTVVTWVSIVIFTVAVILVSFAAINRDDHGKFSVIRSFKEIKEIIFPTNPCKRSVEYTLGTFDEQFNISRDQFLELAAYASGVWDIATGREIFTYSESSSPETLKLNLIYDYRQQATQQLTKIDFEIKNDRDSYDALKTKYNSLLAEYQRQKTDIESLIAVFESKKAEYEKEVGYWNQHGGAPKQEFMKLEKARIALNEQANILNQKQKMFNEIVSTLNSTVTVLNKLARDLNINVDNYNAVGASTGEEWSEGEYILDSTGERINIYQFGDLGQLKRVLIHEFGHVLGLDHVDDPKAIMYRLNNGINEKLTPDDLLELQRVCNAK